MIQWLMHWTGLDDPTGPIYAFWSGIAGSNLFPDLGTWAAIFVYLHHHNCHERWCLLPGHKVEGTRMIACRRHHPDA